MVKGFRALIVNNYSISKPVVFEWRKWKLWYRWFWPPAYWPAGYLSTVKRPPHDQTFALLGLDLSALRARQGDRETADPGVPPGRENCITQRKLRYSPVQYWTPPATCQVRPTGLAIPAKQGHLLSKANCFNSCQTEKYFSCFKTGKPVVQGKLFVQPIKELLYLSGHPYSFPR